MAPAQHELLHGTLETLILKTLAAGPRHGYGIARWIEDATGDGLQIEDGSLYPALYRLENRGLIAAGWTTSELGRRVKAYRLTPAGRRKLTKGLRDWQQFAASVARVLGRT
jgi:transcriptional regulator